MTHPSMICCRHFRETEEFLDRPESRRNNNNDSKNNNDNRDTSRASTKSMLE